MVFLIIRNSTYSVKTGKSRRDAMCHAGFLWSGEKPREGLNFNNRMQA